jgi:membrane-associated protease RseP (regulator of RpoE activity)
MSFIIGLLSLIVVLGVLVFVHEAGHFLAAKWAGIYVHRFSLGLGAPIPWLTRRRGETEYSISWLALGGYVKMASREVDSAGAMLEAGESTAAMPPCAYQVFDSSIVSFVSSRTSAPSSAAAMAARSPATPPPITSTSVNCCGKRAALNGSR